MEDELEKAAARKSVGAALRQLRREAGLTLKELARRSNCSWSHLGAIEVGHRWAGTDILIRILVALGVGWADFLAHAGWHASSMEERRQMFLAPLRPRLPAKPDRLAPRGGEKR
jgi:transcriptional regulator with XRE-family HTH domain